MKFKPGSFSEVSWADVRTVVKRLNPDLFEAIEAIELDSSYKLFVGEYAYGAPVIDEHGIFNIQVDDQLIPLNSMDMDAYFRKQLSYHYHGVPLGLVLDGQLQLSSLEKEGIAYPEAVFSKGRLFAVQAAIDFPNKYQATYYYRMHAGARTVYMLPSIANRKKYTKLKNHFNLSSDVPMTQVNHWSLFKELANSEQFEQNWQCRCLFFGRKFIDKLLENKQFYTVLSQLAFKGSANIRNKTVDRMFDDLAFSIRNTKVDRYILNMARYIIGASLGDKVSFKVCDNDNAGPFTLITKAILDIYGLEKYAPLIMLPRHYNHASDKNTYLSIQSPAVDYHRIYTSKNNYLMNDFREIIYVLEKFVKEMKPEVISEVPLYNFNNYAYNFHSADVKDQVGAIKPAHEIFNNDPQVKHWLPQYEIDSRNVFLRACVEIR